ncbi:dihydrolipoamide acetyltransferase family protein [Alicyclobacillus ferrooxydans]|uniref:Dihydrolipoamide acetyltransferase component of pyruvate dehydrogenase complex n=1 Tax=Alicyclobacillus ferrooxydans TaxID=471514 RepID=A0A0P9GVG2_9BACL|nr:dihydrolipoamide acetyltransferase family protein [Alicyclobacillus ferrooxydans]KPV45251.1 hypothetical protein AN477_02285 [Alicyclobacillus ferrooxydans]
MAEAVEVKLPRTAEDVDESVVVLWYKSEGDRVQENDVLLEVQSEKATFEIEAPASGILREICVGRAEVAAVGDILGIIETKGDKEVVVSLPEKSGLDGDAHTDSGVTSGASRSGAAPAQAVTADPISAITGQNSSFVSAPPRIRRLASQLGVDLAKVNGTGPNGRITEADIQAAALKVGSEAELHRTRLTDRAGSAEEAPEPMSPIRKTIAKRMLQSLQQSAQLTLTRWADVSKLAALRSTLEPGVSWNTWVLAAVVKALTDHPYLNATIDGEVIRQSSSVNLGVAVDTDAGLMVPVIKDANQKSLADLQFEATALADKARSGKASSAELTGSTFTVTNLGAYGIEFFTPIINPPEVGILGVGQIEQKVVFSENTLIVMHRLPLSLTFDHRATDGGPAAHFLAAVADYLSRPEQLR